MKLSRYQPHKGFTLVELIIVIIILGIIAVTALPRIITPQSVQPEIVLSELVTSLKESQMKAMNDTAADDCYGFALGTGDLVLKNCRSSDISLQLRDVSFSIQNITLGSSPSLPLYFNAVGCLSDCGTQYQIDLGNAETKSICIHQQGFIEANAC